MHLPRRTPSMPALLATLLVFGAVLAFTPSASAHTCEDEVPGDCGDCPSGDHRHALTGGVLYRCTSDSRPTGCPTPISPLIYYPDLDCLSDTGVSA